MAWHKPGNLREWVAIFKRHQKKFFFTAGLVMVAVFVVSWWFPEREFQAEAKFDRAIDPSFETVSSGSSQKFVRPWRARLKEDLTGKPAIEQLVEDLKLTAGLARNSDGTLTRESQLRKNEIVAAIRANLPAPKVQYSNEIDQVTVTYTDTRRELAPVVVNTIVENYIRQTDQRYNEWLLNTKAYYEKQADKYRNEFARLDKLKVKFEMDNPGLLPEDPMSVQNMLTTKQAELDRVSQELDRSRTVRLQLDKSIKEMPDELTQKRVIENPDYRLKLTQKADLLKELDNHILYWNRTEEHPLVKKTRDRLAQVQEELDAMEKEVQGEEIKSPNVAKQTAKLELDRLTGTIDSLVRQQEEATRLIDQYSLMSRRFTDLRSQYNDMTRELAEAKEKRDFWEKALDSTMQTLAAHVASRGMRLSFHTRADMARASSPTLARIIIIALVAGLAAGAASIFLAELLDHSFRTIDQAVNELKLPVLGAVTEITTTTQAFRRKLVNFGLYPALGVVTVLALIVALLVLNLSIENPKRFDRLVNNPLRSVIGAATP